MSSAKQFNFVCDDSYSHPYKPAGKPGGDAFTGGVHYGVRVTPFSDSQLSAKKQGLRDLIGEGLTVATRAPISECD